MLINREGLLLKLGRPILDVEVRLLVVLWVSSTLHIIYTHTLDMDYVYRQNLVSLLITD